MAKTTGARETSGASVGYEAELRKIADALRSLMDAAEYKHVVLGLLFLNYIFYAFESQQARLEAEPGKGADPEDPDECCAFNVSWVLSEARWDRLRQNARQPTMGQLVDSAMEAIERDNPFLKGVRPNDYARPSLDGMRLGQPIDFITNIPVGNADAPKTDRMADWVHRELTDAKIQNMAHTYRTWRGDVKAGLRACPDRGWMRQSGRT